MSNTAAKTSDVFVTEDDSTVQLGNGLIEITFDKVRGSIEQVRAVDLDLDLRSESGKGPEMAWELTFFHAETPRLSAPSYGAELTAIETRADDDSVGVTMTWANPRLYPAVEEGPRFDGEVTVDVTIKENDPLSYWDIHVENNDELAIKSVQCPKIMDIEAVAEDGTDGITLPSQMGRRFVNPTHKFEELGEEVGMTYPSGFGTMQFTAYTGPNGGFYSDARDTDGHVKRWRWGQSWEDPGKLRFEAAYFSPNLPGENVSVPYTVTLGALDGRWYDAADRYRSWMDSEGWLSGYKQNQPDWLRDLGATYRIETYHPEGTKIEFERAGELVQEMQSYLDVPLQFQFGQWQHGPDDSPVEGWEEFGKTVETATSAGIRTNSFVGGNIINRDFSVFEENDDATDWVVRDESGERDWLDDQEELYLVETTQDGWQQYIRSYIENLLERGVTEIQFDGFPYVLPDCHASNHDHPPGQGGNWYATAAREDTRELRTMLRQFDDGVLSGEGICDFYLPYLDVFNTRDVFGETYIQDYDAGWIEMIPLFEYAFGDVVVSRNQNHGGPDYRPTITWLHTARSLLWGALPVFRHGDPEADPETSGFNDPSASLEYVRRAARARAYYANRFLARGTMLPPPIVDSDEVVLTTESGLERPTDAIQASAWESDAGETGVILTNVSSGDTPRTAHVDLAFDDQPFTIPEGESITYAVRNGDYERVEAKSASEISIEVAPDDVVLVVVAPQNDDYESALEAIVTVQETPEDERNDEAFIEAKRAFESGDYADALERAESALSMATQSSEEEGSGNESTEPDPERTGDEPEPESEGNEPGSESKSSEAIPGFGVVAGVIGVIGAMGTKLLTDSRRSE
ncbi:DUF6259 domain-containing protein [Natronosalvus halobius]|uniref:DUF6259 domain-containing protein n=1 Tax=Natronosalvus halobius TaxID=2953746 RepID=UPI0020A134F9|nr:DUF6259 domain-containing protein [Natronosalvus halobius]USZ71485.1 DUF6259 domain-containing protein [Natronosalvus halobius]